MTVQHNKTSSRNTPHWRVGRRLLRLLIELDDNMIEKRIDNENKEYYSPFSHEQTSMNFLRKLGIFEGDSIHWKLIECDLNRAADIILHSAPFGDTMNALVSTTIYNNLLFEQPKPFSLPLIPMSIDQNP